MRKGYRFKMKRRFWSSKELSLLRTLYPQHPTRELAARLKRTVQSIHATANNLGLKKTEEFLHSPESRARTQFQKGHIPFNKALRRPGWHAGRMRETQFKKGVRTGMAAKNWVPIGTIRPDSDGYLRIKVREAVHGEEATGFGNSQVWPMYSRYLWEQSNGPIPAKHLVIYKDGKRENCVIENLELISMAENARRNKMWGRMPPELAAVIQLNGVLKRKIRSIYGKEQNQRSSGSSV
jgi:hypothetical protein